MHMLSRGAIYIGKHLALAGAESYNVLEPVQTCAAALRAVVVESV